MKHILHSFGVDRIQFVWFWDKPIFHWWALPTTFKENPSFHGRPIMWRFAIAWVEIRIFPVRKWRGDALEKRFNKEFRH